MPPPTSTEFALSRRTLRSTRLQQLIAVTLMEMIFNIKRRLAAVLTRSTSLSWSLALAFDTAVPVLAT